MSASIYFRNEVRQIAVDGDVNMANANARIFLSALGFDTDFENAEAIEISEFKAALERYLFSDIATVIDNGRATKIEHGSGGATMIDCGIRPGYLTYRVTSALQLTIEAQSKGATAVYLA